MKEILQKTHDILWKRYFANKEKDNYEEYYTDAQAFVDLVAFFGGKVLPEGLKNSRVTLSIEQQEELK